MTKTPNTCGLDSYILSPEDDSSMIPGCAFEGFEIEVIKIVWKEVAGERRFEVAQHVEPGSITGRNLNAND